MRDYTVSQFNIKSYNYKLFRSKLVTDINRIHGFIF